MSSAEDFETVLKPGMVIMAEPNPITADGLFGIFLGHTFIVTAERPRMRGPVPAGDRGREMLMFDVEQDFLKQKR